MSVNTEAADLLLAARDDLLANGWCQHSYGAVWLDTGRVCLLGAISRQEVVYDRSRIASEAAKAKLTRNLGNLSAWNDWPGRTVDEVTAALTATAAELKERDA